MKKLLLGLLSFFVSMTVVAEGASMSSTEINYVVDKAVDKLDKSFEKSLEHVFEKFWWRDFFVHAVPYVIGGWLLFVVAR